MLVMTPPVNGYCWMLLSLYPPGYHIHDATSEWWCHQMETFSALLALCAGNSPVTSEFPAQRPVTRSFDVFFDLRLNKRLSKQSLGWWSATISRTLWRHRNVWQWLPLGYRIHDSCRRVELVSRGLLALVPQLERRNCEAPRVVGKWLNWSYKQYSQATYRPTSNIRTALVAINFLITQMQLEHRLSALLQLQLHPRLNTWFQ